MKISKDFNAMNLFSQGTQERALIDIIANRSNLQRQQIKLQYKTMYGEVCKLILSIKIEIQIFDQFRI
jgi:hypothetical protein